MSGTLKLFKGQSSDPKKLEGAQKLPEHMGFLLHFSQTKVEEFFNSASEDISFFDNLYCNHDNRNDAAECQNLPLSSSQISNDRAKESVADFSPMESNDSILNTKQTDSTGSNIDQPDNVIVVTEKSSDAILLPMPGALIEENGSYNEDICKSLSSIISEKTDNAKFYSPASSIRFSVEEDVDQYSKHDTEADSNDQTYKSLEMSNATCNIDNTHSDDHDGQYIISNKLQDVHNSAQIYPGKFLDQNSGHHDCPDLKLPLQTLHTIKKSQIKRESEAYFAVSSLSKMEKTNQITAVKRESVDQPEFLASTIESQSIFASLPARDPFPHKKSMGPRTDRKGLLSTIKLNSSNSKNENSFVISSEESTKDVNTVHTSHFNNSLQSKLVSSTKDNSNKCDAMNDSRGSRTIYNIQNKIRSSFMSNSDYPRKDSMQDRYDRTNKSNSCFGDVSASMPKKNQETSFIQRPRHRIVPEDWEQNAVHSKSTWEDLSASPLVRLSNNLNRRAEKVFNVFDSVDCDISRNKLLRSENLREKYQTSAITSNITQNKSTNAKTTLVEGIDTVVNRFDVSPDIIGNGAYQTKEHHSNLMRSIHSSNDVNYEERNEARALKVLDSRPEKIEAPVHKDSVIANLSRTSNLHGRTTDISSGKPKLFKSLNEGSSKPITIRVATASQKEIGLHDKRKTQGLELRMPDKQSIESNYQESNYELAATEENAEYDEAASESNRKHTKMFNQPYSGFRDRQTKKVKKDEVIGSRLQKLTTISWQNKIKDRKVSVESSRHGSGTRQGQQNVMSTTNKALTNMSTKSIMANKLPLVRVNSKPNLHGRTTNMKVLSSGTEISTVENHLKRPAEDGIPRLSRKPCRESNNLVHHDNDYQQNVRNLPTLDFVKYTCDSIKFANVDNKSSTSSKVISANQLPDIDSEYSDEELSHKDSSPKKGFSAPQWANSPELRVLLQQQQQIDPDEIFGPIRPLQMEDVFRGKERAISRFRPRSSSANWSGTDRLTVQEIKNYAKAMGYKKDEP